MARRNDCVGEVEPQHTLHQSYRRRGDRRPQGSGGPTLPRLLAGRTISLWSADHRSAVDCNGELLGAKPYFERPGHAEFRIGDNQTEVGIIDSKYAPHLAFPDRPAGIVVYWHVDDVHHTVDLVLARGAGPLEAPQDRGQGFIMATVVDPFGNILGLMQNPHYIEVLMSRQG